MRRKVCLENLIALEFLGQLGIDKEIILKWIIHKYCARVLISFIRLRLGFSGGLFIYLFIFGLCNDAVNNIECDRAISK
jgi:hypothetical protein